MRTSEKPFCQTGARIPSSFPARKEKATLYELHGALNRGLTSDGEEELKVIGHDNEIVQAELILRAIFIQNTQE